MMNKVTGVIEYVGDKFNGSLKVNGEFYGFKDKKHDKFEKGQTVTLTLEPWESKGKKGFNIVTVELAKETSKAEKESPKAEQTSESKAYTPRDYDSENRGKTRCQLVAASMPLVLTDSVSLEVLKAKVDELVDYIFDGK